jgi:hypothetical protein
VNLNLKNRKMHLKLPAPPSYPAKPMNGGKLEQAEPLDADEWRYRPKWNGRRCLVHMPTMRTWNRQLEENNWVFPAFKKLQEIIYNGDLWPPVLEWLDIELLYGKTSLSKRSIVVLDYISQNEVWIDRMANLRLAFTGHVTDGLNPLRSDSVEFALPIAKGQEHEAWDHMQLINKKLGTTYYEGLVAYNMRALYPIQLFSPQKETRHWIKYRFIN